MRKLLIILLFTPFLKSISQSDTDSVYFSVPVINVTVNRLETSQDNSPSAARHLYKNEIDNRNGGQLSDILHTASNVYIKSYGGNSSLKTISINGLSAENTLILLNGARLNSTQNAQYDLSLLSKDLMEDIEILPSNSSTIYGPDAISGIISINTFRKPEEYGRFNALLSSELGSYNYRKLNAGISNKTGKNLLTLDYGYTKSDDDFSYYYKDGAGLTEKSRENNSYETNTISVRNNFEYEKSVLNFISLYTSASREIPGIETGSEPSHANQKDENWLNSVSVDNRISPKSKVKIFISYQNNLTNFVYPGTDNSYYKNNSASADFNYIYSDKRVKLLGGANYSYATINSNEITGNPVRGNAALYSSSEFSFYRILLYPSARYDYISDINKHVVTGKFGFNIKPFGQMILRGNIGNSYRPPTFNELYWKTGGNQTLVPEKSINLEAGAVFSTDWTFRTTAELNYYYISSRDKIVWRPGRSFYWTPENISASVSSVININLNTRIIEKRNASIVLNAGYSYNNTFKNSEDFPGDPSYGKQLIYIPMHDFKLGVETSYENAGLNMFGYFTAKRYTDSENRNMMDNIFTIDGNAFYKISILSILTTLRFEVNNITNSDYQVIAGYPMPLRNYKFSITFKY